MFIKKAYLFLLSFALALSLGVLSGCDSSESLKLFLKPGFLNLPLITPH